VKIIIFSVILSFLCSACAAGSSAKPISDQRGSGVNREGHAEGLSFHVEKLVTGLDRGSAVAISQIYDGENGDLTGLGDRLRDRIETALVNMGFLVVPRRDLIVLMDERELGSAKRPEIKDLEAGAVISGRYYLPPGDKGSAEVHLRTLSLEENRVRGAVSFSEALPADWHKLVSSIKGNIYHKGIEQVSPSGGGPSLSASLDRNPACYPAGASVRIRLKTERGVHIYILNLAADNTVTLIYPNRIIKDSPMPVEDFEFPPAAFSKRLGLAVYPLKQDETSHEAFKIVASRKPVDFGFLPIPENEIYAGAKGERLEKVLDILKKTSNWSEATLGYYVGPNCSK